MDNYQSKLHQLEQKISLPEVKSQVEEIDIIIDKLNKRQILKTAPTRLGFYPDEFEELLIKCPQSKKELAIINNMLNNFRSYLSRAFGIWSLPNLQTIKAIQKVYQCKTGLEVMAGNAYWSSGFDKVGVKMVATDSFIWAKSSVTGNRPFFPTQNWEATKAIEKYFDVDLIICCWAPNFGEADQEILKTYRQVCSPQTKLLFIGEKNGATNTYNFWQQAQEVESSGLKKINNSFSSFDFIEEKIFEIK